MSDVVDVIIPTCRKSVEVSHLVQKIEINAGAPVRVIATCLDASASENRNAGLDRADTDFRIMLDDDIAAMSPGWVRVLIQALKDHPECVMVSPQLVKPRGGYAVMMGCPRGQGIGTGLRTVQGPHLLTACIALRKDGLRFDENFVGSGWEDNDYCEQQNLLYPGCTRMIQHNLQVVHRNEMKNQGPHFAANRKYFESKWGKVQ